MPFALLAAFALIGASGGIVPRRDRTVRVGRARLIGASVADHQLWREDLTAISAALACGVFASWQLGYGIAAFGVANQPATVRSPGSGDVIDSERPQHRVMGVAAGITVAANLNASQPSDQAGALANAGRPWVASQIRAVLAYGSNHEVVETHRVGTFDEM